MPSGFGSGFGSGFVPSTGRLGGMADWATLEAARMPKYALVMLTMAVKAPLRMTAAVLVSAFVVRNTNTQTATMAMSPIATTIPPTADLKFWILASFMSPPADRSTLRWRPSRYAHAPSSPGSLVPGGCSIGGVTLHADLTALLTAAGLVDIDVDEAVADEHARSSAYQKVVAVAAAASRRDGDRELVATILRDPQALTSKTAVVALVDRIALKTDDPAAFRTWAAGLGLDDVMPDGHRDFVRRRIDDWTLYLTAKAGHTPSAAEIAGATGWMQRKLAAETTSRPVLDLLTESGHTRKIRDLARSRAAG